MPKYDLQLTIIECGDNAKVCFGLIDHCTRIYTGPGVYKCGACEEGFGVPMDGASQCQSKFLLLAFRMP